MKKLYNGRLVPTMIDTTQRIFEVTTYDGDIFLCNIKTAKEVIQAGECKGIRHYWNNNFKTIGKNEVLQIVTV